MLPAPHLRQGMLHRREAQAADHQSGRRTAPVDGVPGSAALAGRPDSPVAGGADLVRRL